MISAIITRYLKSFFSEDHIEGQIKQCLAGVGAILIHNGYQTNDTWAKTCGFVLWGIGALYHFIQTHNDLNKPTT